MKITEISHHVLYVSGKTNGAFIRLALDGGLVGWGECSFNGWKPLHRAYPAKWCGHLLGKSVHDIDRVEALSAIHLHSPGGRVMADCH